MDLRDRRAAGDLWQAATKPDTEQPAPSERMERLHDLVARAERVGEGVDPDIDPGPDVVDQDGHQRAADDEQDQPDDDEAEPAGGDIEHRQEDPEEQQRGAEILLDDDDHEGDRPHRDHRRQIRDGRQPQRTDACVLLDQQRSVLRQVAGKEDDQDHLEQLGRLAAERPELDRQALPIDLRAEHEGQQQQPDADGGPCVLVATQPAIRADDDRECRQHGQRDEQPRQLDLGQAECRPEEGLLDEILRQPFHQQQ